MPFFCASSQRVLQRSFTAAALHLRRWKTKCGEHDLHEVAQPWTPVTPEEVCVCVLLSLWLLHHSWSPLVLCLSLFHVHITLVMTLFTFPTIFLMLPWPLCERWLAANIAPQLVPLAKMAPVTVAGSHLRRQYFLKKLALPRFWLRAWSADTQSLKNMFIATFRGIHTTRFHILQRH